MALTYSEASIGKQPGDWLKWEEDNQYSRDQITVLAGSGSDRELTSGMVISKVTIAGATPAAVAGNTGNGTIASATVAAGAKPGVYRVVCIEPATNAGRFDVEDPDGISVGVATVAVEFTGGGLTFTITDGATDYVAGDSFTITVAAGSGKWVQYLDTGGATGLSIPAGILYESVTAPDGTDAQAVAIVRSATVNPNELVWPSSADSTEKAAALAVLKTLGIVARIGA